MARSFGGDDRLPDGHAPHHVFKEWADKYKGRFDQGYEEMRAAILERQKELGLMPADTQLSPINPHGVPAATGPDGQPWPLRDTVRPWASLSADEKRLFCRMAEVLAGYISYADDVALANWYGAPSSLCVHAETCGLAVTLEHTGDLYSCDDFVEPKYKLGNIREHRLIDLIVRPQQQAFGRDKRDSLPQLCLDCELRFACHGGCPKDRFTATPDGPPGLNYLCPSYREFLRTHPYGDGGHDRPAEGGRGPCSADADLRRGGRGARTERFVQLRVREEVEGLPRPLIATLSSTLLFNKC